MLLNEKEENIFCIFYVVFNEVNKFFFFLIKNHFFRYEVRGLIRELK